MVLFVFLRNTNNKYLIMEIKILGSGCARCKLLEQNTRKALEELRLQANLEKVEDYRKIIEYGVMQTPALVVNEKVVISGRAPGADELKDLISGCIQ